MEYDYYPEEYYTGRKKKKGKLGKSIKWIAILLIIAVYLLLIFRIYIKSDTKTAKQFVWTADTVAAYELDASAFAAFTQSSSYTKYDPDTEETFRYSYDTYSGSDDKHTHDGQFHTSQFIYVPASSEFQITLRYNREAVTELLATYGLTEAPAGELFLFALTDGIQYYTDYTFLTDSRFTYEYRRLVFSGINLESVHQMWLEIYYVGDVRKSSSYQSMTVYLSDIPMEAYSLKKALPAKQSDSLKTPPYVIYGD